MPKYSDYREYESYLDEFNRERKHNYDLGIPNYDSPMSLSEFEATRSKETNT